MIPTSSCIQADVLNAYRHGASSVVCNPELEAERRTLISQFSQYWAQVAEFSWANPDPAALPVRTFEELAEEFCTSRGRPIDILIVDDSEDDVSITEGSVQ